MIGASNFLQIIQKDLFRLLRDSSGSSVSSYFERMVAVGGDLSSGDLGISDSEMRKEMWEELDIIVNSAATTNFHERYDVALAINTFGAANLMNFARKCARLKLFLHVSTGNIGSSHSTD